MVISFIGNYANILLMAPSVLHSYCSPEWPANFKDNVDWICSDCVLGNVEQSIPGNPFCRHPDSVQMSDSSMEIALRDTCIVSQKKIKISKSLDTLQPGKMHQEANLGRRSPLVKNKRTSSLNMNLDKVQNSVHGEFPSSEDEFDSGVKVGNGVTSQARTHDASSTLKACVFLQAQPFSEPTWR